MFSNYLVRGSVYSSVKKHDQNCRYNNNLFSNHYHCDSNKPSFFLPFYIFLHFSSSRGRPADTHRQLEILHIGQCTCLIQILEAGGKSFSIVSQLFFVTVGNVNRVFFCFIFFFARKPRGGHSPLFFQSTNTAHRNRVLFQDAITNS